MNHSSDASRVWNKGQLAGDQTHLCCEFTGYCVLPQTDLERSSPRIPAKKAYGLGHAATTLYLGCMLGWSGSSRPSSRQSRRSCSRSKWLIWLRTIGCWCVPHLRCLHRDRPRPAVCIEYLETLGGLAAHGALWMHKVDRPNRRQLALIRSHSRPRRLTRNSTCAGATLWYDSGVQAKCSGDA